MIKYVDSIYCDMFKTFAQTMVNPVNTVGVMGKGLALKFKNTYPKMFEEYKSSCRNGELKIGKLKLVKVQQNRYVLLFPTKEDWRNPSKLSYIESGLKEFCNTYEQLGITSIAFPKLGCGCGGLSWTDVKPLMQKYLNDLPIEIIIYV